MVTHSSTSRPVQCLCMAERTGCPVLTDLWSYVFFILGKRLYQNDVNAAKSLVLTLQSIGPTFKTGLDLANRSKPYGRSSIGCTTAFTRRPQNFKVVSPIWPSGKRKKGPSSIRRPRTVKAWLLRQSLLGQGNWEIPETKNLIDREVFVLCLALSIAIQRNQFDANCRLRHKRIVEQRKQRKRQYHDPKT
jgi:hypothetical protein